jgi:hypothetical protein
VSLSENATGWLYALLTTLIFALVGLAVPNLQRQSRKRRAHNFLKFWNEFLARHQLGYFTFYLAITFTATFVPGFDKRALAIPLGLTILFYILGVYLSTNHQDDLLEADHACPDDKTCTTKVGILGAVKVLWPNAIMAYVLGRFAWWTLTKIS